jgi:hypothetical protein
MRAFIVTAFLSALAAASLSAGERTGSGPYVTFPELRGPYLGQIPPGRLPQPFCEAFLNPPGGYHSSITFSPDMSEVYWTSMGAHTFCSRLKNGVWTVPVEIEFDSVYGVGEVALSADGKQLYFLSRRPPDDDPVERERIWRAVRETDKWSSPEPIDLAVRSHPTHWQFSLARNGNLYFTSEIAGARGEGDIYVAPRDGDVFASPLDLGPNVNSDLRDFTPFVAADESYLIFARSVPEENNRSDLFISFRTADGDWTKAINMGDTINTEHNEVCPVVTPDGKYLFYTSVSRERNAICWVSTGIINDLMQLADVR